MTTGTTSRTAHLLALMKGTTYVRSAGALPGISHPKGARGSCRGCRYCAPWLSARITQHA